MRTLNPNPQRLLKSILVLSFFFFSIGLWSQQNYVKRLNCGDPNATSFNGNTYEPDPGNGTPYNGYEFYGNETVTSSGGHSNFTLDDTYPIFNRTRYTKGESLKYVFPVDDGDYQVSLHYAEPYHGPDLSGNPADHRQFNIEINGTRVENNLCLYCEAGGSNIYLTKTYTVTVSGGAGLTLELLAGYVNGVRKNDPIAQGIEVLGVAPSSDTTPPSVPTAFAANGHTDTTVGLSWNASTDNVGVVGYELYNEGATVLQTLGNVTSTQVANLSPNTSYSFRLKALDAAGNKSAFSTTVTVTTDASTGGGGGTVWTSGSNNSIYYTNGNVGIGVSNPSHALDLNGTLMVRETGGATSGDVRLFNHSGGQYGFMIRPYQDGAWTFDRDFGYRSDFGNWYVENLLSVGTTTVPSGYAMAVNGKMIAEEVKIQLRSQWPDYVFENGYDLPSLEELEEHIKEKGHLINIPSAAEVEAHGIFLGDMNRLLLEKIEELTLYTLQQEKRIEQLERQKERNDQLEKRLKQLEQTINEQ